MQINLENKSAVVTGGGSCIFVLDFLDFLFIIIGFLESGSLILTSVS